MNRTNCPKRLLTLFPRFTETHISKDVGAIPLFLVKTGDWQAAIAYFGGESIQAALQADDRCRGITFIPLGPSGSRLANFLRIFVLLLRRGRTVDVLNYYHDSVKNLVYAALYKLVNPRGRVYCKLDMSYLELERLTAQRQRLLPSLGRRVKFMLSKLVVDWYSAETVTTCETLAGDYYFRGRLHHIPNGIICPDGVEIEQVLAEKSNIILTVGNLGARAKYNELLIDAVAQLPPELIAGWQVYLVGPVVNPDFYEAGYRPCDDFRRYVDRTVALHPHLAATFVLTGAIDDRSELNDLYRRARIFCLTSRYESFGFVVPEAMFFGAYLLASDIPPMRDLTDTGRVGSLFPVGSGEALAGLLSGALQGKVDFLVQGRAAHQRIKEGYDWQTIVSGLARLLAQ